MVNIYLTTEKVEVFFVKRLVGVLLALLVCAALLPVQVSVETSGTCGDNLTWVLDDAGTLTISGTGEVNSSPWAASDVKQVIINDGVTNISDNAFLGCYDLMSILLPDSGTIIDGFSFGKCYSLTDVTIPDSVMNIGDCSFTFKHNRQEF